MSGRSTLFDLVSCFDGGEKVRHLFTTDQGVEWIALALMGWIIMGDSDDDDDVNDYSMIMSIQSSIIAQNSWNNTNNYHDFLYFFLP